MLFIVEGPDGSGKTTLIKKLRETLPCYTWILASNSQPKSTQDLLEYVSWVQSHPSPQLLLCDRYPVISESIYAKILGRECLTDTFLMSSFSRHLVEDRTTIIYCRPPTDQIKENVRKSSHREGVKENIEKIIGEYDTCMYSLLEHNVQVFTHDYTYKEKTMNADKILSLMGKHNDEPE